MTVIKNPKSIKSQVIFQPSRCFDVDLSTDFSMGNSTFLVKINDSEPVTLDVIYTDDDVIVSTMFFPGWNPDQIKAIKANSSTVVQVGF